MSATNISITRNRGTSMDAGSTSESTGVNLTELTADIVSAYVAKNAVRAEELATLISTVHSALSGVGQGTEAAPAEKPTPPMPWKKAIKADYIISFEDGKHYKSMRRHLTTRGMTPEQYREKWGLPRDFPMVAPSYAAARSELAKKMGLGQKAAGRKGKGKAKKAR
jgi:predicted transcriptional regulator